MDIKNLRIVLQEKLLKENNTENNVIKQAENLLKQHLPELYEDYTKHNNLGNRFTTYAADQHAPDFNIVENYIEIREGRNGMGKNFEFATQWNEALQYFEDLCKKYQDSKEYKQFINVAKTLTPIMKQFENDNRIKDNLNKWFYQCYNVCIWLNSSRYNKTEYTVTLRNNKINIYVGHRGRILASYDTNVTGSQIANVILENLVPKKEYISRGLGWKVNTDEAPYLYAFSRRKAKDYRDPNMAIGAVQPDGTIYYYWIDESGRETSDTIHSMPSKDVINKLKREWKKYSQESGEPNPFEQIQESYEGRNMDIKKLNENLKLALDSINKKCLKEDKRVLATKDQEYLNNLLKKYGDNASIKDIIKQETKSLKEDFDKNGYSKIFDKLTDGVPAKSLFNAYKAFINDEESVIEDLKDSLYAEYLENLQKKSREEIAKEFKAACMDYWVTIEYFDFNDNKLSEEDWKWIENNL